VSSAIIQSPLPGTFYRRPSPDRAPFKADGDAVATSDAIGVIEVMKSFIEVNADIDGTSIRFLVEDGDAVMAGEALAEVQT
jgi:acetyl-CoA carboxylase biotin carboxyl carrier protein